MTTISEKTRLPLGLVITLIALAGTTVGGIAVAKTDLANVKTQSDATEVEVRDHDRRIQKVEDSQVNTVELLKEIKSDLRALRQGK